MHVGNKRIIILALLTITLFPLLTIGCFYIFENQPISFLLSQLKTKTTYTEELIYGSIAGIIAGYTAWIFIQSNIMRPVLLKYGNIIKSLNLTTPTIIFVSFCAGFGEELFFRGAIQNYLGIWITAILFIAIHGYLDPRNWRVSLYGLLMTLIIAFLGLMTNTFGLLSAMIAHTIIDIILFYKLTNTTKLFYSNQYNTYNE